jgi:D-methionine transport system substrate-binding protein
VVELTSGVNANELLANGDVDANYFQHVPYLKDQEKRWAKPSPSRPRFILSRWGSIRASIKISSLPENATVAVPNNTTNLSRALFLLQSRS